MVFPDGKAFVFCGELYNHNGLRGSLGGEWNTKSDTEVFLKALCDLSYGESLSTCDGMWAFALYDPSKEILVLSRDRFGEKPLYVYQENETVYFGSEPKYVFALLGRRLPIDDSLLKDYLLLGYKVLFSKRVRSFFKRLVRIAPGTYEIYRPNVPARMKEYHNFEQRNGNLLENPTETLHDFLCTSLGSRFEADVPLAFCLSGGVDSNVLVSLAKKIYGRDITAFTIVMDDARYNEEELAALSARELGIEHVIVRLGMGTFLSDLRKMIQYHESPISTISYYVHWFLVKMMAEMGFKVAVSGTGGDELFGGYYDHWLYRMADLYRDRGDGSFLETLKSWKQHVLRMVRNPEFRDWKKFIGNVGGATLRSRMRDEIVKEIIPVILHEDDLNCAMFGMENRSPFLSDVLYELSSGIPDSGLFDLREGFGKAVLRKAMAGIVPQAVLDSKRKIGFNAPIEALFDRKSLGNRAWLLSDSEIWEWVDRRVVKGLLDKSELDNEESKMLFRLISAKMFMEEFR
jgi:asparagine synthase (glutamine-hydrolysing)